MKTTMQCVLLAVCLLYFTGCKEAGSSSSATETPVATAEPETAPKLEIDPATDPLVVGAEFANVLSDTLNVQMYEMTMKPGDSVGLHVHPDHTVYVLQGGTLMLYLNGTDAVEMELATGLGFVSGPLSDAATNIGETDVKLLISEIYRPRE